MGAERFRPARFGYRAECHLAERCSTFPKYDDASSIPLPLVNHEINFH